MTSIQDQFVKAKQSQPMWASISVGDREQVVKKFCDLLQQEDNKSRLANLLTREMGKPISQSLGEISDTKERINYFLENTRRLTRPTEIINHNGAKEFKTYEPLGVIANISAWNYPYFVGANVFIPALLTGNAVLYKPSEYTAQTGFEIEKLFEQAGMPSGIFQCVLGDGSVGQELLNQNIDGVFFTGSYATGKKIAEQVALKLIKLQLELGGKDPLYVTDDVDIDYAAEQAASGAFYNAGQSCCAVERLYVHDKIYDEFLEKFISEVKSYQFGDPLDKNTFIGPLARAEQVGFLKAQVSDALEKGAQVVLNPENEYSGREKYFSPKVITNCNHDMDIMREESFGPVIGIMKVGSDEEALELMQDTDYGLTASVFCKDPKRATLILENIKSGSAYVNCCDRVSSHLPWLGQKNSGLGATSGEEGIMAFVMPKAWHVK